MVTRAWTRSGPQNQHRGDQRRGHIAVGKVKEARLLRVSQHQSIKQARGVDNLDGVFYRSAHFCGRYLLEWRHNMQRFAQDGTLLHSWGGPGPDLRASLQRHGRPRKGIANMNGAESLVRTLVGGGVNVCFTNPGTSEMHFVAALDKVEGMRCVLAP